MKRNGLDLLKTFFEYSTLVEMVLTRVVLLLIFCAGIYFVAKHIH